MTSLIATPDDDAALSVQASLRRAHGEAVWAKTLSEAYGEVLLLRPLVCVTDTALHGYQDLIELVRRESPWARVHLMADPAHPPRTGLGVRVVQKPFDAAEFADVLLREEELAELDRGKRDLQTHVDELAVLVQECFEAIIGLDPAGFIRSWNPGAAALYGYTADEALGHSVALLELSPDGVTERLRRGDRQVLETPRRHKDGRTVEVLLSLSLLPESASSNFRFVEVSLDITEHRRLKQKLEHSERLAAIGRIAATMAHEINNPLAVIQASTVYLSDIARQEHEGELAECASDLRIAAERIQSFVQHICGFARRERPLLSDLRIDSALEMALRLVRPRARARHIEIVVGECPDTCVPHDPPRVSQAILNLLSNAVDAAAHKVELGARVVGSSLVVDVDDDGSGIPDEFLADAFEPFATTKPYGQGTGLGLAITRQIVEEHRGSVSLGRRATGGTHAELRLPLLEPGQHRIVVLEDAPAVRRALGEDVRRAGFQVFLPRDGREAEQELRRGASAVISDVRFGERRGAELSLWITAECPKASRLLVADSVAAHGFAETTALSRPWKPEALVSTLRQLCIDQEHARAPSPSAPR